VIREDRDLELSGTDLSNLVSDAMRYIGPYLDGLAAAPSALIDGSESLARSLREALPEMGLERDAVLRLLFERVIPTSFNTAGPGYLAYIPGGGLPESAVADLIADATNRYVGVFAAAPGVAQIEANVVSWFCRMIGYPEGARGILTSGGSMAGFSAIFTARRERLGDDFLGGTLYVSDQTHHSIIRAAILAGFPAASVCCIETDDSFRIRLDRLEEAIARDRASGATPFLLVGNAGTTNTGAVDDLEALADLAARERLWFHVDGAYGGFFALTGEGRRTLRGIERSDSVVLGPHKGLFLPYGTGSLLVRDGETLARAHAVEAEYLPAVSDEDMPDFSRISPELSRDWRGLRVWLPIRLHGIAPFRTNLEEKLHLAKWAADQISSIPGVEMIAKPQLSLIAFRLTKPGLATAETNDLNRRFLEAINQRRRVYLSGTMVRDMFVLRICILSFRTHLERMEMGIEDIRASAAELA
jgi:aromatic-L-amino-acid decarboxylase